MQFVLIIYHGTASLPGTPEWESRPEKERRASYVDYAALNQMENLTPGPPLGLPENATTVREWFHPSRRRDRISVPHRPLAAFTWSRPKTSMPQLPLNHASPGTHRWCRRGAAVGQVLVTYRESRNSLPQAPATVTRSRGQR
jgi:hypothetical protein